MLHCVKARLRAATCESHIKCFVSLANTNAMACFHLNKQVLPTGFRVFLKGKFVEISLSYKFLYSYNLHGRLCLDIVRTTNNF